MKENVVQLPPEALPFVQERADLWNQYAQVQIQVAQLNELAGELPAAQPTGEPLADLSPAGTPPAETGEVVKLLNQELEEIKRNNASIEKTQGEIAAIKKRAQSFYVAIAVVVVLLVVAAYFLITS